MGGCSSSQKAADKPLTKSLSSIGRSVLLLNRMSNAGIEPTQIRSRAITKEEVLSQRRQSQSAISGSTAARVTLTSIKDQPRSNRMSRIGTLGRGKIIAGLAEASSPTGSFSGPIPTQLDARLKSLGMKTEEMAGDGNCQFRSFADQLFGAQKHHEVVRGAVTAHMQSNSDFFGMYFEGDAEFKAYMSEMKRGGTWGDELTMRAAVEAFGCVAHVVTSEPANWYLVYNPEADRNEGDLAKRCGALGVPTQQKEIFVSYISPIHYNAIRAL